MGLPRKLKNFNVFYNGITHIGECQEVECAKLERHMEEYRGGGMNGPIKLDMGMKALEITHSYGGLMYDILRQFGQANAGGVLMRFAGAYQRDDFGAVDAIEIVCRGRHEEIDQGKAEAGGKTEFKIKSTLTYYKITVNGLPLVEIDLVNFIEIVGGIDRLAEQRAAIGA